MQDSRNLRQQEVRHVDVPRRAGVALAAVRIPAREGGQEVRVCARCGQLRDDRRQGAPEERVIERALRAGEREEAGWRCISAPCQSGPTCTTSTGSDGLR